jgi:hypothetical protein
MDDRYVFSFEPQTWETGVKREVRQYVPQWKFVPDESKRGRFVAVVDADKERLLEVYSRYETVQCRSKCAYACEVCQQNVVVEKAVLRRKQHYKDKGGHCGLVT